MIVSSGGELITFDRHFEAVPELTWTHVAEMRIPK